ncbi:MAG: DUF4537 domain-containing protein [Oscillospiraceae bacterium]|nr:DUF4537 domain-containing protein [Oscillospiraceae bacterium]
MHAHSLQVGETVFALWAPDGFYYPSIIQQALDNDEYKISFLDGHTGQMSSTHIVKLQEALSSMKIQSNWGNFGTFYPGTLSGTQEPFTIHYDDGDISRRTKLRQLRGIRAVAPAASDHAAQAQPPSQVVSFRCDACTAPLDIGTAVRGQPVVCKYCGTQNMVL